MKSSTRLALAFLALASFAGNAAFAEEAATKPAAADETAKAAATRFERFDVDSSGDLSFEEFSAAMKKRFAKLDANGDGMVTVAEITTQINGPRAERVAARLMERFDANRDGSMTLVEIDGRQKKMFALLDRNDDGKIVASEMPVRKAKAAKN